LLRRRFRYGEAFFAQTVDVFGRRTSESPSVFTGELRGTHVLGAPRGSAHVEHQASRYLQLKRFLELQRAHGGHGAELPVKGGEAHVDQPGQLFDIRGLI
jgi:hypothetical protein